MAQIPAQRWVTLSHRRLQAHPSTLASNGTLLAAPLPTYLVNPVVDRFNALGVFEDTPHQRPNHVLINEYRRGEGIMPHEDGDTYAPVVATVSLGASICLEISPKPGTGRHLGAPAPGVQMATANESGHDALGNEYDSPSDDRTTPSHPAHPEYKVPTRILQEPRSLLVTTGAAYVDLLHGISPIDVDEDLSPESVANWNALADSTTIEAAGGRNERATRISLTYRDVLKVSSAAKKVFGGIGKR